MRSFKKLSLAVALFGLLVMAGVSAGSITPNVLFPVNVKMVMSPQIPGLGETAEVVAKVNSPKADLPKGEIYFGLPDGKQIGVELVGTPAKQTFSLKQGENKEFRFKIKFVGPEAALVSVTVKTLEEVRLKDGSLENLHNCGGEAGWYLKLNKKDKKFYLPYTEPKDDPYANLQKELGLPEEGGESGYWYSVALHLQDDLVRYAPAKGIGYEEAKKVLKDRAERMYREEKMEKSKAYETILTHRLLWKEAKLPDPFEVKKVP